MTRKAGIALLLCLIPARALVQQEHQHPPGRLGTVHFETTCSAPAQKTFDHAMALLHSFEFGEAMVAAARRDGIALEMLVLPADPEARIDDEAAARAQAAYFSGDVFPSHSKQFFSATRKATQLKWLHVFNAGVDHPVFASILERGVRLTIDANLQLRLASIVAAPNSKMAPPKV